MRKTDVIVFNNLISLGKPHSFSYILLVKLKSLGPVHMKRRRLHRGIKSRRQGLRVILEAACPQYIVKRKMIHVFHDIFLFWNQHSDSLFVSISTISFTQSHLHLHRSIEIFCMKLARISPSPLTVIISPCFKLFMMQRSYVVTHLHHYTHIFSLSRP